MGIVKLVLFQRLSQYEMVVFFDGSTLHIAIIDGDLTEHFGFRTRIVASSFCESQGNKRDQLCLSCEMVLACC